MFWQQPGPPAFRNGNVNQRDNRAAQIENPNQVRRAQWKLAQQRPIQHFLDIQHREAEALAPATENAILRLRPPLFERPESFQQLSGVGVCG
jgi:hypothetical protein